MDAEFISALKMEPKPTVFEKYTENRKKIFVIIISSPRTLVVGSLNVHGCSSIEIKKSEIGCMFGRRGWMYWLCVRRK